MPARCPAVNQDGSPCAARPSASGWCPWHDPALAEQRRENAIKGGRGRSSQARARKALKGGAGDLAGVQATLLAAIGKVEAGALDPGPANAMANLARAVVAVSGAADFDRRLAELERALADRSAS